MKPIVSMIFLLLIYSCTDEILEPGAKDFYYNSFEVETDARGWEGISEGNFCGEAAPEGGNKSVIIGGGCVQPAASLNLGAVQSSAKLRICFQAKMVQENQGACLYLINYSGNEILDSIAVSVSGNYWKGYDSNSSLNVTRGDSLRIDVIAGGYFAAEVMLDCLRIYYVQ